MNVEELRTVQRTERQKDSLQHLRDSFYRDVADYLAERKAERERVAAEADDPFSSPAVGRLTDEIETAEEVVESIYERRVGKIVKRATFAAAGMATEDEGLTSEERDLFEDLVARIETNRASVLDGLVGDANAADATGDAGSKPDPATGDAGSKPDPATGDAGSPSDPATTDAASPPTESASSTDDPAETPDPDDLLAEAMGGDDPTATDGAGRAGGSETAPPADERSSTTGPGSSTGEESPAAGPGSSTDDRSAPVDEDRSAGLPRTTVRITRDVGSILGVDEREYDLASEDVVTLPTPNAEPLLDRDAAERLDDP